MNTLFAKIFAAVAAVAVALCVALSFALKRERAKTHDAELARTNVEARNDSSRAAFGKVLDAVRKEYGDSLRTASERLIVQERVTRDAIDKITGRTSAAIGALTARIDALTSISHGDVTVDTADVRHGHFDVDTTLYAARADVSLPRPPARGTLTLDVVPKPFTTNFRVQCGEPRNGIRPATAFADAPAGITVTVGRVQADPNVCNPVVPSARRFSLSVFAGEAVVIKTKPEIRPVLGAGGAFRVF